MNSAKFKTVLLVDDDPITNYLNERLIHSLDISENVLVMSNGETAFEFLKDCALHGLEAPEVILLDINMPVADGYTFLENFTQLQFKIKQPLIIILTTSSHQKDRQKMSEAGIKYFLIKPLGKEKLLRILEQHFDGKSYTVE